MVDQIGNSPAGVIEKVSTHTPPKRHIYWRPMFDKKGEIVDWVQTLPLPAETAQDKEQYLSRGFKWDNPMKSAEAPVVDKDKITNDLLAENQRLRQELEAAKVKDVAVPSTDVIMDESGFSSGAGIKTMTPAQEKMAKVRAARGKK